MSRRTFATVAVLAFMALGAALLLQQDRASRATDSPMEPAAASIETGDGATDSAVADPATARVDVAEERRGGDSAAEPPAAMPLEIIQRDPTLRDRLRQQELAEAADARWAEAVDSGEYSADDLDPAIRDLFRQVSLQPRYAEGGGIEGLVIRSLAEDHPLAAEGFETGDMIDRIQGVDLRDPAELPSLLAHLGPNVEFCARQGRTGAQLCRELVLDQ